MNRSIEKELSTKIEDKYSEKSKWKHKTKNEREKKAQKWFRIEIIDSTR